jgi:2,3-bisphosphoglycerate-dependent phosphoglycerate mutase
VARVDLYVQNTMWTVGEDDFLHSFFSTVAYQVEKQGWGSRFPALVGELYRGSLPAERVPEARRELETIRRELGELPPEERVYDYDDPNRETPWPVPPGASSLADGFLTATGKNVLDVLERALDVSEETGAPVEIRPFQSAGQHTTFVTGERPPT